MKRPLYLISAPRPEPDDFTCPRCGEDGHDGDCNRPGGPLGPPRTAA